MFGAVVVLYPPTPWATQLLAIVWQSPLILKNITSLQCFYQHPGVVQQNVMSYEQKSQLHARNQAEGAELGCKVRVSGALSYVAIKRVALAYQAELNTGAHVAGWSCRDSKLSCRNKIVAEGLSIPQRRRNDTLGAGKTVGRTGRNVPRRCNPAGGLGVVLHQACVLLRLRRCWVRYVVTHGEGTIAPVDGARTGSALGSTTHGGEVRSNSRADGLQSAMISEQVQ